MNKRGVFVKLKKLGMVLFIAGVLISLFSGVFEFVDGIQDAKIAFLVSLGALVGLLNISDKEQINFLISSGVFILASGVILQFAPARILLFDGLFLILYNLNIFVAPATVVVSLKLVFEYMSEDDEDERSDLPSLDEKHHLEIAWDVVVLVAVALTLVVLILESFFDVSGQIELVKMMAFSDYLVLMIFVIDAGFLFSKSDSIKTFFKKNWLDLIAIIPFNSLFRITKLLRATRILRIFTRAQRSTKFFSNESGFNTLVKNSRKSTKNAKDTSKKASRKTSRKSSKKSSTKKTANSSSKTTPKKKAEKKGNRSSHTKRKSTRK